MKRKTKKTLIISIAIVFVLVAAIVAIMLLVKSKMLLINQYFITDTAINGVDISKFQGDVNFDLLKSQKIEFVYIKATEGSSYVDTNFKKNWENATKSGMLAGAYHFFSFDSPGANQAKLYIETVGDLEDHLVPAIDIEWYGDKKKNQPDVEDVVRELKDFIAAIEEAYEVKPIIYASKEIYAKYLKNDFSEYRRWVRSVFYPVWFDVGDDWLIWQYCDKGQLEGVGINQTYKEIDLNVIRSRDDLEALTVNKK